MVCAPTRAMMSVQLAAGMKVPIAVALSHAAGETESKSERRRAREGRVLRAGVGLRKMEE